MKFELYSYLPLAIFIAIACLLAIIITCLPILFAPKKSNSSKLSPYECGFEPFTDARGRFDIRFYLVSILFIIFDLEIAFMFPWAISLGKLGWYGFWSMMIFIAVLSVGFIYEWAVGALDWE